jgi:hypothetical protein
VELIDKAIKAMGGPAKVAKLQRLSWKGKLEQQEGNVQLVLQFDSSSEGFDRHRLDVEAQVNNMNAQNVVMVIRGDKAWIKERDKVKEIKGAKDAKQLATLQDALFATRAPHLLPALKGKVYGLSHLGEVKIGDEPAVGLVISRKDRPDLRLFFDKKTHLPVKAEVRLAGPDDKEIDLDLRFTNYKEIDGVKHFTRLIFKAMDKEITLELSDLQTREKFDDGHFDRPQ